MRVVRVVLVSLLMIKFPFSVIQAGQVRVERQTDYQQLVKCSVKDWVENQICWVAINSKQDFRKWIELEQVATNYLIYHLMKSLKMAGVLKSLQGAIPRVESISYPKHFNQNLQDYSMELMKKFQFINQYWELNLWVKRGKTLVLNSKDQVAMSMKQKGYP